MVELDVKIGKLQLRNPLILASGILGETANSMERIIRAGAGAVTTKSIGLEPREGHKNPTIVELDYGLLNAMGLPNPGIEEYKKELKFLEGLDVPVIGSIFGKFEREFCTLAGIMEDSGISALELNLSCPHAMGYGAELGTEPELVFKITKEVKGTVKIPVLVKLTPNTSDIVKLGNAAISGGCDALVAINTLKGIAISADLGIPVLHNKFGGYSGPGIKPIGLRCVYELASANPDVPIIGVGGILSGIDLIEYLMAGASAAQVGTAIYYYGEGAFKKILSELKEFMEKNGYSMVKELIGLAQSK